MLMLLQLLLLLLLLLLQLLLLLLHVLTNLLLYGQTAGIADDMLIVQWLIDFHFDGRGGGGGIGGFFIFRWSTAWLLLSKIESKNV